MIYYQGETISKYIYFKDKAGAAIDPNSTEAKVYDSEGTLKATLTLTKVEVGKYEINYTVPNGDIVLGDWSIIVKGVKGLYTEIEKMWFTVVKQQ